MRMAHITNATDVRIVILLLAISSPEPPVAVVKSPFGKINARMDGGYYNDISPVHPIAEDEFEYESRDQIDHPKRQPIRPTR